MNVPAAAVHPHLARLVEASAALSALPASAGPAAVFEALYDYAAAMFGVRNFLVGLYDRATGLIRCGYAVVEGERRKGDPPALVTDTRKMVSEIGWRPTRSSLTDLLRDHWEWVRAHPEGFADRAGVVAPV